jgi:HPt (histidine-containing phosphotransfer) domain-containing protein
MEVPNEIMLKYIERRKRDLEDCMTSLASHQYEDIERVGHQLKGNGATFGHPELSQIGKKLEQAAQVQDIETLQTALKEFSQWVHSSH